MQPTTETCRLSVAVWISIGFTAQKLSLTADAQSESETWNAMGGNRLPETDHIVVSPLVR